ncbi:hypothetical protein K1719_040674 [Acacia pycnantha]|nr:hypothetical protein K1719_040674 [Acacia pycnantha]
MIPEVIASLLHHCSKTKAFWQGLSLHAVALKTGSQYNVFISNHVLNVYAKCACTEYTFASALSACASLAALELGCALSVYNNVVNPNSVSYNALITGYVENHEPEKGFELFKYMHKQGLVPDSFTFMGLLGFCTESNDLRTGMVLHCQTIKLKFDNTLIGNVTMAMYAKSNFIEEVEKAFRVIKDRDVISWNTIISSFSHSSDQTKCLKFFTEMGNECSTMPDDFTFPSILAACASNASILLGKQIHAYLIRARENQNIGVSNALMSMYAKIGSIGCAYTLFNKMSYHNIISWNTMITAFGNHGLGDRAIETFEPMKAAGVKPDSITFVALLIACNHAGLVDKGKLYFNSMKEKYGITANIEHFSCLIDMLGQAGRLSSEAEEYMKEFHQWNGPIVLGSLLSACGLHGNITTGERLARQLLQDQPVSSSPYALLIKLICFR